MLLDINLQNTFPAVGVAAVVAGLLMCAVWRIQENIKIRGLGSRAKIVPGTRWWLFGVDEAYNSYAMAKANRNAEHWATNFERSGTHTLELAILGKRVVLTDDPENIKAVLATQFHDYGKGESFHRIWSEFLGDSIFTTDGHQWSQSRALIRPQFAKDRMSDLRTFERHITHMITLLPKDGSTVDISDFLYRFTLDTATDFLLGGTVNALGQPRADFAEAFAEIQKHMNDMTRTGLGLLRVLFPQKRFRKNLKILNSFVEPFVERTLKMRPEELKNRREEEYNFLHALAEFTRDPRMLRDQLVAVLLAARDTTAGALSWTFYELAKQPKIVEKLRAEILDRLGTDKLPTYVDLKEMKYLHHIINETLRLYPAVPFNIRTSLKDTYLPRGGADENGLGPVGMPKGTIFGYSTLTMQRREDLFGPDVMEYNPDRWEKWSPKTWQYIPFNGGPRICIGQQYALSEMAYTLVRLFQHFEAVESRQCKPQFERCEVVISPGAGVQVSLKPVHV